MMQRKKDDDVIYIIEEYQDPEDEEYDEEELYEMEEAQNRSPEKERVRKKETDTEEKPVKKKKKRKHRLLKLFIKLMVLLAFLLGLAYFGLTIYFNGMKVEKYTKLESSSMKADNMGVTNILIIGTDTRNSEAEAGRSDCIMLLSINRPQKKIELTSFLRDSYVEIPEHGMNRINAAFQFGGAPLLIQTIENNFLVTVDGYIVVDFFSFMKFIDAVGGVNVDVDEGEANYVNMYLCEINKLLGEEQGDGNLTSAGRLTLTGKQALAYSRIRYIGTDFARTDRQREVLTALIGTAKSRNYFSLLMDMREVFPEITTSLSASRLSWYALFAPFYLSYEVEQQRIPADGTWKDYETLGMQVLSLDFTANINILWKSIYGRVYQEDR